MFGIAYQSKLKVLQILQCFLSFEWVKLSSGFQANRGSLTWLSDRHKYSKLSLIKLTKRLTDPISLTSLLLYRLVKTKRYERPLLRKQARKLNCIRTSGNRLSLASPLKSKRDVNRSETICRPTTGRAFISRGWGQSHTALTNFRVGGAAVHYVFSLFTYVYLQSLDNLLVIACLCIYLRPKIMSIFPSKYLIISYIIKTNIRQHCLF